MKFSTPLRAPEGLNSYARVNKVRPVQTAINIVEAIFTLCGVVLLILVARYGSFEKAGQCIDHGLDWAHTQIVRLVQK